MSVHNHGPAEGPGLGCPETRTPDGKLRGACIPEEPYDLKKTLMDWTARKAAERAAVDPAHVTWPGPGPVRVVHHPWDQNWAEVVASAPPPTLVPVWDDLLAWVTQRALERRVLEEMEAILKARPADAPGVILIRSAEETIMVESEWIQPGTIVYSMPDQPDLMVQADPDGDGYIYYRQTT